MNMRLAHAMVQVRDLDTAIAFYTRVLDLVVAERHAYEGAALAYLRAPGGGAELELLCESPWRFAEQAESGRSHVAFTVADVPKEHARIRALGIPCGDVSDYIANGALQTRFFYLYDRDGNEIEILEAIGRYTNRGEP